MFSKKLSLLFVLFFIIFLAAFLRLYRLRDYLLFLGDQGRDVLVVKSIILNHKLTLLGPTASVGGFYLGPFYYYLMVLPLWLAKFDPVGPAVMVALFGVATVFLLFVFIKKIFKDEVMALFASVFYAFSPLTVQNSRFSWNPNVLPFFSLLLFYLLYQIKLVNKNWLKFLAGVVFGICIQLHYLSAILLPLALIWFLFLDKEKPKNKIFTIFLFFIGGFLIFSPLVLFELRHNFNNFRSILEFLTRKNGAVAFYPLSIFSLFLEISERMVAQFLGLEKNLLVKFFIRLGLILVLVKFLTQKKNKSGWGLFLLWWLGGGLLLRLYQGTIYSYYYGFLYPVAALILALIFSFIFKNILKIKLIFFKFIFIFLITSLFFYLLYFMVKSLPFFYEPNKILEQTERIAESIIEYSQDKPYNFALISRSNSDHAYRYFLEVKNKKPTTLEEKVTEQLLVVCEEEVCEPLGHPLWEIAAFGRAEISQEWQDKSGIKIFKLVHHPDSLNLVGKPALKGQ